MLVVICVVVCLTAIAWLTLTHLQTQDAMQWWQQQQVSQWEQTAETIRDGLLQETFALRRSLELDPHPSANQHQTWVTRIEHIDQSLKQLENQLVPAFSEDSLPLALHHALSSWQTQCVAQRSAQHSAQHSCGTLTTDLPHCWPPEPAERSHTLLTIVQRLLTLVLPADASQTSIQIQLKQQDQVGILAIQIMASDLKTLTERSRSQDLARLCRASKVLTAGWWTRQTQTDSITWSFHWRLQG